MRHHEISGSVDTMVWGSLDAAAPPVMRIASGDEVTLHACPAGGLSALPPDQGRVEPRYLHAIKTMRQGPGAHMLVGPIHVEGALPGDTLQVDILDVKVNQDWGFVSILPLLGTLPDDFTDYETIHPDIDLARGRCRLPWGDELELDPFFGIMAVAPPPQWGVCSSNIPRSFGGNMDNKELRPGATLYLPIFNEGALFYAGDGHGVQGDGEVCITALETGVTGRLRLTVRKDFPLQRPFAENATHLIAIGLDEDLDTAARQAVREMIAHVCARSSLTRNQAYMLCSLAGDLRVTQTVDGNKGCHMMLAKARLGAG